MAKVTGTVIHDDFKVTTMGDELTAPVDIVYTVETKTKECVRQIWTLLYDIIKTNRV